MRVADALLDADVRAGRKYIEASGHSWPGFDWRKQWRYRTAGGNPISAFPGMLSKVRHYFEMRTAFDDDPLPVKWEAGRFDPREVNEDCLLVEP